MMTLKTKILAGMVLGLGAMMVPSASASDVNFSFGFGRPTPVVVQAPIADVPVTTQRWIGEHYEDRAETVLVAPAHYEQRWVDAVYEVRTTRFGRTERFLVTPAHYENILVPARYETRTVSVLVPGCYSDSINVGVYHYDHDRFDRFGRWDRFDRFDRDHHDDRFHHDHR
jgi:hypothetical protein